MSWYLLLLHTRGIRGRVGLPILLPQAEHTLAALHYALERRPPLALAFAFAARALLALTLRPERGHVPLSASSPMVGPSGFFRGCDWSSYVLRQARIFRVVVGDYIASA